MGVKLARTAGFCMGVKRAVDMVLDLAPPRGKERLYTYGPLIHNPQTIALLKLRGITPIERLDDMDTRNSPATLIIRAHGISPRERREIKARGIRIIDATCPKVAHVQAIIKKHAARQYHILIIGDRSHPEVNGLLGYAGDQGTVISSAEDVGRLPALERVCVVAQTTQGVEEFETLVGCIRDRFPETVVFNTICDSTEKRQTEVRAMAAEMEAMLIVGGQNSANTQRLARLSERQGTPTFHIETAENLSGIDLSRYRRIGVSAGASTPNWIIHRVVDYLENDQGEKRRGLLAFWTLTVRTEVFSAIGAAGLSLACMFLQGLRPDVLNLLTAALYVYAMHTLNRFLARKGSIIGSFREATYRRHERRFLSLAVLAMVLALTLAFLSGWAPFILLFTLSALGLVYNLRILPSHWRFRGLSDLPGSKNVAMALAWAAVTAFLPRITVGFEAPPSLTVAFCLAFSLVFVRSALSDILDIQSDRLIGRETIPVLIGKDRTLVLLKGIALLIALVLVAAPFAGWAPWRIWTLMSCPFYVWICFIICDREAWFPGVLLEGLLESVYLVAGLSAGVGLFFPRGFLS